MVQVDQHPSMGVWLIKGVIGMRATGFTLFHTGGLVADLNDGIVLA